MASERANGLVGARVCRKRAGPYVAVCLFCSCALLRCASAGQAFVLEALGDVEMTCAKEVRAEYAKVIHRYVTQTPMLGDARAREYFATCLRSRLQRLAAEAPRKYDELDLPVINAYYRVKLYDLKRALDTFGRHGIPSAAESAALRSQIDTIAARFHKCLIDKFSHLTDEFVKETSEKIRAFLMQRVGGGLRTSASRPMTGAELEEILRTVEAGMRKARESLGEPTPGKSSYVRMARADMAVMRDAVFPAARQMDYMTRKGLAERHRRVFDDKSEYAGEGSAVALLAQLGQERDRRISEREKREDALARRRDREAMTAAIEEGLERKENRVLEKIYRDLMLTQPEPPDVSVPSVPLPGLADDDNPPSAATSPATGAEAGDEGGGPAGLWWFVVPAITLAVLSAVLFLWPRRSRRRAP